MTAVASGVRGVRGLRGIGDVRALTFDIFGTVVDWRSSIIREGQLLGQRLGLSADWPAFADAWRAGYQPAMAQVRAGELPWTNLDGLHRRTLGRLLAERGIELPAAEAEALNRVWHRLMPWPDSVAGLHRLKWGPLHAYGVAPPKGIRPLRAAVRGLKPHFTLATLSNGNLSLLVSMARHAGLAWDTVLSAELFGHYKPDPEVYLGAARLLGLEPAQLMMVAAHPSDLRAAAACGLRTAYVPRPLEHGPGGAMEAWREGEFDVVAADFVELAQCLGR